MKAPCWAGMIGPCAKAWHWRVGDGTIPALMRRRWEWDWTVKKTGHVCFEWRIRNATDSPNSHKGNNTSVYWRVQKISLCCDKVGAVLGHEGAQSLTALLRERGVLDFFSAILIHIYIYYICTVYTIIYTILCIFEATNNVFETSTPNFGP